MDGLGRRWLRQLDTYERIDIRKAGAQSNGSADDAAAIQRVINYFATVGGGIVVIPVGTTCIGSTITIKNTAISLEGAGWDGTHDTGTVSPNTGVMMRWVGSSGGTMILITPPSSPAYRLSNNGVRGISLLANGLASIGVDAYSTCYGCYNFAGTEFSTALMQTGVDASLTAESADFQYNDITLDHRNTYNAGSTLIMNGNTIANTSLNNFHRIHAVVLGSTQAIIFSGTDNNLFYIVSVYGAGTITQNALLFEAVGNAAEKNSNNMIYYLTTNMGIYGEGTEQNTYPSQNNNIIFWDTGNNSSPNIGVGTGASLWVGYNGAPLGYRKYVANVGGTSTYIDNTGKITMSGFLSVPANSVAAVAYPQAFTSGITSIQVTPTGGTAVLFSSTSTLTAINIYNTTPSGGTPTTIVFSWKVEGY